MSHRHLGNELYKTGPNKVIALSRKYCVGLMSTSLVLHMFTPRVYVSVYSLRYSRNCVYNSLRYRRLKCTWLPTLPQAIVYMTPYVTADCSVYDSLRYE